MRGRDGEDDRRPFVLHREHSVVHARNAERVIAASPGCPSWGAETALWQARVLNGGSCESFDAPSPNEDGAGGRSCAEVSGATRSGSGASSEMLCPTKPGQSERSLGRGWCEQESMCDDKSHGVATLCLENPSSERLSDASWAEFDEQLWPGVHGSAVEISGRCIDLDMDFDDDPSFLDSLE